jgi:hypothetical protein
MSIKPPPMQQNMVDESGIATLPWTLFFDQSYRGDSGESWSPVFTNLTTVGTPTIKGRHYQLSRYLTAFFISITPSTSTTATGGTTYIGNYPLTFTGDGACWAVSGGLGANAGHIVSATNRIYVPSWSAVTVPLTVVGFCEAT